MSKPHKPKLHFVAMYPLLVISMLIMLWYSWWFWFATCLFVLVTIVRCYESNPRSPPYPEGLKYKVDGPVGAPVIFFMHGWPDHGGIWAPYIDHFKKTHRCVWYDMPGFGKPTGRFDWGYSFEQMADITGRTLQVALKDEGKETAIVMSHDWGAAVSELMTRKNSHLVEKLVLHDVYFGAAHLCEGKWTLGFLKMIVMFGFIYQYILASIFLFSSIPLIGLPIGNLLARLVTDGNGAPLCRGDERSTSSAENTYFYLYFHTNLFLELVGFRSSFDKRHGIKPAELNDFPKFLLYSTEPFHCLEAEKELLKRDDCDVLYVKNKENEHKYDHWFLYHCGSELAPVVHKWLNTGKKHDYTWEATGF